MEKFDIGTITLSFDDARKDTLHVMRDIMLPRSLPGVVYVPTGYIETHFNDPVEIGFNGLMTKKDLDDLNKLRYFEISGHGHMHRNTNEDIALGISKLREWYPEMRELGFASPHSHIKEQDAMANLAFFQKLDLKYVRGGRNFDKYTSAKRGLSLLARYTHSPLLFMVCYKSSIMKERKYFLRAVPVHKKTKINQIKAVVDFCAKHNTWAILEFHGIDVVGSQEYKEDFCWDERAFIELCDYLKALVDKGKIAVKTPLDIMKS